jgi:hypothetical protein
MKPFAQLPTLLLAALLLSSCATHLEKKENYLRQAGFRTVIPSTPEQIAHLRSLRQRHICHETRNGQTLYMLADDRKNLLLVGGDAELSRYQEILYAKEVDPDTAGARFGRALERAWNSGWGADLGSLVPQ